MARRLAQLTAFVVSLTPALALALGIGSIETRSALNEPLEARIPLLPDDAADLETVSIRLATPDAFQRAGLDRPFFLSRLNFEVVRDGSNSYVAVTTEDTVREPFLAFVVEVRWAGGRLLREYTLLLDPPVHQPREAPPTRMAEPEPAPSPAPQAEPARPARQQVAEAPSSTAREYGPVQRNQTLWDIAVETRPDDSVSVHQMMMALLRANPDAFSGGNVNNLRAGAILRVPERSDIESLTVADARREFARQTQEWQAGRTPQPTAPADEPTVADARDPSDDEPDGRLQVVAAGETGGNDPTATVDEDALSEAQGDVQRLEGELTALREREASLRSEADELRQMNDELRQRVEALERLVNLQADPSLVEAPEADPFADVPMVGDATAPGMDEPSLDDPALEDEFLDEEAAGIAAVEPPAGDTAATGPEGTPEPDGTAIDPPAQASAPLDDPFATAPPPAPWEDPRILASAGGVVALLLLLLLVMARRRRRAAAEAAEPMMAAGGGAAVMGAGAAAAADDRGAPVDAVAAETAPDPIAEAEMYMGHGRHDQARETLQRALIVEPDNTDMRLKLLEIHALDQDRAAFEAEAQALYPLVDGKDDPVWQRAAEMGREIAPEHPLFPAEEPASAPLADAPVAGVEQTDALDQAFDLDGDDGLEPEETRSSTAAASPDTDIGSDAGDEAPIDLESMEDDLSDLEFALDDDGDSIEDKRSPASGSEAGQDGMAAAEDDEFALDFDVDSMQEDRVRREAAALTSDDVDTDTGAADETGLDFELDSVDKDDRDDVLGAAPAELDAEVALEDDASALDDLDFDIDAGDAERASGSVSGAASGFAASNDDKAAAEDEDMDDLFEGADENSTKLDLARAYLDMGDSEGARSLLEEVMEEGSADQKQEAEELLGQSA